MFKVLSFLTKKEGIETQEFIDYYENKHVLLICSMAPTPIIYKRRYLSGEKLTKEGSTVDFDVVTKLAFPDQAAFLAWMTQLPDQAFASRWPRTRPSFSNGREQERIVVEEHVTSG